MVKKIGRYTVQPFSYEKSVWEVRAYEGLMATFYSIDAKFYAIAYAKARSLADRKLKKKPKSQSCQASKDGECFWDKCPQIKDGEPTKSGRHCPNDFAREKE